MKGKIVEIYNDNSNTSILFGSQEYLYTVDGIAWATCHAEQLNDWVKNQSVDILTDYSSPFKTSWFLNGRTAFLIFYPIYMDQK